LRRFLIPVDISTPNLTAQQTAKSNRNDPQHKMESAFEGYTPKNIMVTGGAGFMCANFLSHRSS
jgi:hypothetical protein